MITTTPLRTPASVPHHETVLVFCTQPLFCVSTLGLSGSRLKQVFA